MREDLHKLGGEESAEVTAFFDGATSRREGWVAASSTIGSSGKAEAGGTTQGGVLDG